MKKILMVMIAIACSMVIPFSTLALSYMQATESVRIKNGKNPVDANAQPADSASLETFNSDILQASKSDVTRNTDKVDDFCKVEDGQMLSERESTMWSTEANQSQIFGSFAPLPDGRIFLRSSAGTEDQIPYIPTENPKMTSRTPIVPLELDI
jgi:hypothetical protein